MDKKTHTFRVESGCDLDVFLRGLKQGEKSEYIRKAIESYRRTEANPSILEDIERQLSAVAVIIRQMDQRLQQIENQETYSVPVTPPAQPERKQDEQPTTPITLYTPPPVERPDAFLVNPTTTEEPGIENHAVPATEQKEEDLEYFYDVMGSSLSDIT